MTLWKLQHLPSHEVEEDYAAFSVVSTMRAATSRHLQSNDYYLVTCMRRLKSKPSFASIKTQKQKLISSSSSELQTFSIMQIRFMLFNSDLEFITQTCLRQEVWIQTETQGDRREVLAWWPDLNLTSNLSLTPIISHLPPLLFPSFPLILLRSDKV